MMAVNGCIATLVGARTVAFDRTLPTPATVFCASASSVAAGSGLVAVPKIFTWADMIEAKWPPPKSALKSDEYGLTKIDVADDETRDCACIVDCA